MRIVALSSVTALLTLIACAQEEQAELPTDYPCGPGAWDIEQTPSGPVCHPKGWK